jgi:hypothetical protein
MPFYAEFANSKGCMIRRDTRIYLNHNACATSRLQSKGTCIGAVYMCNPGSSGMSGGALPLPTRWGAIPSDPTLRKVRIVIMSSRHSSTTHDPSDPYIQVLNLFYAIGPAPSAAWKSWVSSGCHYNPGLRGTSKFALLAWGRTSTIGRGPIGIACSSVLPMLSATRNLHVVYSYMGTVFGGVPRQNQTDHPYWPKFPCSAVARSI